MKITILKRMSIEWEERGGKGGPKREREGRKR